MLTLIKGYKGFLWIGDPHVSSKNIGRRKDNYLDSVLEKLEACAAIANWEKLVPVIAGDLFHRNDDSSLKMLNRLVKSLRQFETVPVCLEGNHDKGRSVLSEEDALTLLAETGCVALLTEPGMARIYQFGKQKVALHAAPYGSPIPAALSSEEDMMNVLITHHDMAFGSAYPGAQPLTEIEGCLMVLNGHMHDTKPSVVKGQTTWHNPGNIEPLSVDLAAHIPCAWEWQPVAGTDLVAHRLPHGTDLFDLTGIQVEAADAAQAVEELTTSSEFAELISSDVSMDAAQTSDASVLEEDLKEVLEAAGASDGAKSLMLSLIAAVSQESLQS